MLIDCPLCGARDLREFTPRGSADLLLRPAGEARPEEWHAYLHLRDNPAGSSRELWCHSAGCGSWLVVTRDTTTHAIGSVHLVGDEAP